MAGLCAKALHTTLTDLRAWKNSKSARDQLAKHLAQVRRSLSLAGGQGKAFLLWKHCYAVAKAGPCLGTVINPDNGAPPIVNDGCVLASEFEKIRRSEIIGDADDDRGKNRCAMYSPLCRPTAFNLPLRAAGVYRALHAGFL